MCEKTSEENENYNILRKINPFGEFNFCVKLLKDMGIPSLFDQQLV